MATKAGSLIRAGILEAAALRYSSRSRSSGLRIASQVTRRISSRPLAPAAASSYTRKPSPLPSSSTRPPHRTATSTTPPSSASKSTTTLPSDDLPPIQDLANGLLDNPILLDENERQVDWTRSFHGLSAQPFSKEAADVLLAPIAFDDVECKPDGIIYLPEIKYRRILNKAFGPGGWGLAPRGETVVTDKSVTREYALVAHGRLVSVARGEQSYFSAEGIPTATEGCKSNALMRCCKDLGIASELWDPVYIRAFMKEKAKQVWVEHAVTKKKKQIWLRRDGEVRYPFKESKFGS